MIRIFILVVLPLLAPLWQTTLALSKTSSPETRLRRLSMHIRGTRPSLKDYEELRLTQDPDTFFKEKTRSYLSSPLHAEKLASRLEQLFRLSGQEFERYTVVTGKTKNNTYTSIQNPDGSTKMKETVEYGNSLNSLFRKLATDNLPWHRLLTAREYSTLQGPDYNFFFPEKPPVQNSYNQESPLKKHRFAEDDLRVAGALSTYRFYGRYTNTALNQNRRRAAAVFRIFLCDDMEAAAPALDGPQDGVDPFAGILDQIFPKKNPHSPKKNHPQSLQMVHGSQPSCASCHSKLDPLGKTFRFNHETALGPIPAPGALVFTNQKGARVEIQARGLKEIGTAIVQQPEYAQCQVRHFWSWFIGEDQPLSKPRLEDLTKTFRKLKERTNDFIAYLVEQPEFIEPRSTLPTQIEPKVLNTLKRCDACHDGLPNFESLFASHVVSPKRRYWAKKIQSSLNLNQEEAEPDMPPPEANWVLTEETKKKLKKWIQNELKN